MREPTTLVAAPVPAAEEVEHPAPRGPSNLRREILLRLRLDGPSSPDQLADRLGASRTGVLPQLRALEAANPLRRPAGRPGGREPRQPADGPPRRRPAEAPLRRHARRAGPLPVELRRAGVRAPRRDRSRRRRRPVGPGVRGSTPPARRPRPRTDERARRG